MIDFHTFICNIGHYVGLKACKALEINLDLYKNFYLNYDIIKDISIITLEVSCSDAQTANVQLFHTLAAISHTIIVWDYCGYTIDTPKNIIFKVRESSFDIQHYRQFHNQHTLEVETDVELTDAMQIISGGHIKTLKCMNFTPEITAPLHRLVTIARPPLTQFKNLPVQKLVLYVDNPNYSNWNFTKLRNLRELYIGLNSKTTKCICRLINHAASPITLHMFVHNLPLEHFRRVYTAACNNNNVRIDSYGHPHYCAALNRTFHCNPFASE